MTSTTTISKQSGIGRADRFESNRFRVAISDEAAIVRAASLLLGLELRGWLSQREQEYLDGLAPDNALTFLVQGKRYVHPAEVPLFSFDLIEAAVLQGGDAVFSHRCDGQSVSGAGLNRLFTGVIGGCEGSPLVLGMFGPDGPTDKVVLEDRFAQVINAFRAARESVRGMAAAIGSTPPGAARILVNRASGRVIHVDQGICAAVHREPSDFVSREYGVVEPLLEPLVRRFKMKLENFACGCLHVSCLTFQPAREAAPQMEKLPVDLIESLRGDIAGITTAAEYVSGNGGILPAAEVRAVASEMARMGRVMGRRLARHQMLAQFEQLKAVRVNVVHHLDCAIDRITGFDSEGVTMVLDPECEGRALTVPPEALVLVFETVLEAHIGTQAGAKTAVQVRKGGDTALEVSFRTEVPERTRLAELERTWPEDAERLARRLGVQVQRRLDTDSHFIITTLTFGPQEILA